MSQKFTFEHDFFRNGITALNKYLIALFKPFEKHVGQAFAISIANTGDEKFIFDIINDKKIYENVPRFTLSIAGLSTLSDENTSYLQHGNFYALDENNRKKHYATKLQRKTVEITFNSQLVFNNILEYFTFIEIYLTLTSIRHSYSFYHAGKRQVGTFELPEITDSEYNKTFGFNAENRNVIMEVSFILQLQFPAYQIYGTPGSAWEGHNGYNDPNNNDTNQSGSNNNDGSGGNGSNPDGSEQNGPIVNAEPMNAIIHHMHASNPDIPEGRITTLIVTKDKQDD